MAPAFGESTSAGMEPLAVGIRIVETEISLSGLIDRMGISSFLDNISYWGVPFKCCSRRFMLWDEENIGS